MNTQYDGMITKNLLFDCGKPFLSVLISKDIFYAVRKAYNAMQPRTYSKKRENAEINTKLKKEVLEELANDIANYFAAEPPRNFDEFDDWHKNTCDKWLKAFNIVLDKSGYNEIHYGKAQKIVNVTLKTLFLYDDAKCFYRHFAYGHFVLSSENLEWYKKYVDPKWIQIAWSNLTYNAYITIQKAIREFLAKQNNYPKLPFYAEFYVWNDWKR